MAWGEDKSEFEEWRTYYLDLTSMLRDIFGDNRTVWPPEIRKIADETLAIVREKDLNRGKRVSAYLLSR